jgi:glycosyltransferase involved in cell wall biosynthesis
MKEFIFWQGVLSIHQSALLRSLASLSGVEVTLVVWEELGSRRRELGWDKPDFGKTKIIVRPSSKTQSKLVSEGLSDSVNIFSGTRGGGPMVWNAFLQSLSSKAYIGIYSEAQNGMGLKGFLRFLMSKYDALRFREKVNFILGIGSKGVEWFKKSAYLHDRIFPFGYFVETPLIHNIHASQEALSKDNFDLIFVGRPLFNKGLDILLNALHSLRRREWRLHVVGDGNDRDEFVEFCAGLGLTESVQFYGMLPNSEVINLISKSDLLVLPSRWDGWGAVVNEALMLGVPVVCSDKCGAADLLDGRERGEIVSSESISSLRSVLSRRISQGKKNAATSEKIREWSRCINGESAADYFLKIINASIAGGSKPIPPWFKQPGA